MNKEKFIMRLKQELYYAFCYFENTDLMSHDFKEERNLFFDTIKDLDIKEIHEKVMDKYGWLLNYYREFKKKSEITTIKKILIFFLVITVISIIIAFIVGISIATS